MKSRLLHLFILPALLIPSFSFAAENGCAASLRDFDFDTGKWISGVMAVGTFSLSKEASILDVKYIWGGKFHSESFNVRTKLPDEENLDVVLKNCENLMSEGKFCSKVKSVKLVGGDHEDDAFIFSFLDTNGTELGRIAGFPGLIGECLDLEDN